MKIVTGPEHRAMLRGVVRNSELDPTSEFLGSDILPIHEQVWQADHSPSAQEEADIAVRAIDIRDALEGSVSSIYGVTLECRRKLQIRNTLFNLGWREVRPIPVALEPLPPIPTLDPQFSR